MAYIKWSDEATKHFTKAFDPLVKFPTLRNLLRATVEDAARLRVHHSPDDDLCVQVADIDAIRTLVRS